MRRAGLLALLILLGGVVMAVQPAQAAEPRVDPNLRRTTIHVSDMEASLRFWRDGMGLQVLADRSLGTAKTRRSLQVGEDTPIRFVTLGEPGQEIAMLGLLEVKEPGRRTLDRPAAPRLAVGDIILVLTTGDAAGLARRAEAHGGRVIVPLEELTRGTGVEVVLADPDGVRVQVLQFDAVEPVPAAFGKTEITRFRDCPGCPDMVVVPAGSFAMGAEGGEPGRYEGPVRRVSLAEPFALGRFEVTQDEFARFVEATGHRPAEICRTWVNGGWTNSPDHGWTAPGEAHLPAAARPVICVSWQDALAYAAWLAAETGKAYRLPTEAEWEYAARAGASSPYPWGEDPAEGCAFANIYDAQGAERWNFPWEAAACDDGHAAAAPVGQYRPNAFGLHDMVGNVWEWVQDCYVVPYPDLPDDGTAVEVEGICERRSVRGGSWITRPDRQRPAWRGRDPVDRGFVYFGFRVARDLDEAERAALHLR